MMPRWEYLQNCTERYFLFSVLVAFLSVILILSGFDKEAFAASNSFDFVVFNVQQSGFNGTGAFTTYSVTAINNGTSSLVPVCTPASGSFFNAGISTVTCYAIDSFGSNSTVMFSILVNDVVAPIVTASPSGGSYSSSQSVILSSNEPATIYYTTDGSTPTESSTIYSSPIVISVNSTLKYFGKDTAHNTGSIDTQVYTIKPPINVTYPFTHMSDTTQSFGLSTFSGRQIHAEFVSATSELVGDKIDQITVKLKRAGAPTGMAEIGIFNSDLSVKKLFGTKDASTLTTAYTDYTFSLNGEELYTISSGDRIGIKYTGGNSANSVAIMVDNNAADPFDGGNTYRQHYTTSWQSFTAEDLYMMLVQTHAEGETIDLSPPTVAAFPFGGLYASSQSVTLSADEPATIYYTTDGSTPTTNSSSVYSEPILISSTTTLKFFAIDTAGNISPLSLEEYVVDTAAPIVTVSPLGSTYIGNVTVTLSADEPATIYYTTEGTTPTTSSQLYNTPVLISENTTLKFFGMDTIGNSGNTVTEVYTIIPPSSIIYPFTHMSDTTASFGLSTFAGRQIQAEFVSATSELVGDKIDSITIKLKRAGTPTGTAEIGIFNSDLSVKKLFGTKDASTLTTSYLDYTFALSGSEELYTISSGDRIGIKYTGGNSANSVAIMVDNNAADPFDGTNTYHQYFTTTSSWQSFTSQDLYMMLKQTRG